MLQYHALPVSKKKRGVTGLHTVKKTLDERTNEIPNYLHCHVAFGVRACKMK